MGVEKKPGDGLISRPEARDEAVNTIVAAITDRLGQAPGVRLRWEWEQLTHEAVTASSENLIEVVREEARIDVAELGSVSSGLTATLGLLAAAARDRTAQTGVEASDHAFSALLPILQDRAEYASQRVRSMEEHDLNELLDVATDRNVLTDRTAGSRARYGRLNRMVHISIRESEALLLPGNVYELTDELAKILAFDAGDVLADLVGTAYKEECGDTKPTVVIAEVSPACDFSQDKIKTPRVLGGALIPIEKLKKVPREDSIYKSFGVFHFDDDQVHGLSAGTFHFALNARFLSGVPRESLETRTSLFRIRQNTLVDVQAWSAWYGSRPGVITIAS